MSAFDVRLVVNSASLIIWHTYRQRSPKKSFAGYIRQQYGHSVSSLSVTSGALGRTSVRALKEAPDMTVEDPTERVGNRTRSASGFVAEVTEVAVALFDCRGFDADVNDGRGLVFFLSGTKRAGNKPTLGARPLESFS